MTPGASIAETHISVVFFAGDRAYKLLKPVQMPFLDYSTLDLRLAAVDRELELNRRMAPDVYLGTADVIEGGKVADRFLVMERMPEDQRLPNLLATSGCQDALRSVARRIAQFHADQPPLKSTSEIASAAAVLGNWEDNVWAMEPFVGSVLREDDVEEANRLFRTYLRSRAKLFDNRMDEGLVRDCHGDLTAEDIFCLDDGPRILDCLAFRDDLRISDVLLDVAFLAMDLERLAGPQAAQVLMGFYAEFSNEHHPTSLAHHYIAYRAHVRAKVACLRHAQGDEASAELAAQYHALCLRHLRKGRLRMVLIGGGPGTGKTTLSNGVSSQMGWVSLNSDELRKDLTGYGHHEVAAAPFGEGIYSAEITERTYQTLMDRALTLLEQGESVVLDATWAGKDGRIQAKATAEAASAEFFEFECDLGPEDAKQRISDRARQRREDASDATVGIVDRAFAERDPWPSATPILTTQTPGDALKEVLDALSLDSGPHVTMVPCSPKVPRPTLDADD